MRKQSIVVALTTLFIVIAILLMASVDLYRQDTYFPRIHPEARKWLPWLSRRAEMPYKLPYIPQIDPRFEIEVGLEKVKFKVGEPIVLKPRLIFKGSEPITLTGSNLFYWILYDERGRIFDEGTSELLVFAHHYLKPHVPYSCPFSYPRGYLTIPTPHFKPGRYRIVLWAMFWNHKYELSEQPKSPRVHVYAKPIWVQLVAPRSKRL